MTRSLLLIVVLSVPAVAQMGAFAGMSDTDELYRLATQAYTEEKFADALREIDEVIRLDPKRGPAYRFRAAVLNKFDRNEECIADADLGIKLSKLPRDRARAAYNKGSCLYALNRRREAMKCFMQAVEFDPTYPLGHFGKGKTYYSNSTWEPARKELEVALGLDPNMAAAWALLAECQFHFGLLDEGMQSAERSIRLNPSDPRTYRARALGFYYQHRYEEMLSDATQSLETKPRLELAHFLRGGALELLGRYQEALQEYSAEPDREMAGPHIASIYQALGGGFVSGTRVNNPGNPSMTYPVPR